MGIEENGVELAACLQQLRNDLLKVEELGKDSPTKLRIEKIDLELTLAATNKASGEAGVKWYILSASAGAEVSSVSTQKVSISMSVVSQTGQRKDIHGIEE